MQKWGHLSEGTVLPPSCCSPATPQSAVLKYPPQQHLEGLDLFSTWAIYYTLQWRSQELKCLLKWRLSDPTSLDYSGCLLCSSGINGSRDPLASNFNIIYRDFLYYIYRPCYHPGFILIKFLCHYIKKKKNHEKATWSHVLGEKKTCAFRRESEEGCRGRGAAWRMYWWRWDAGEVWDTGSFGIKEESIFAVLETLVTFTRSWVSHKLPIKRISPFHLSSPLQSAVGGQGWGQHITNKGILEIEGRCCLLKRN